MAVGTTMAILGAAAIGGIASLAGGAMQANAAEKAAGIQATAADNSLALQKEQYDQSRADSMPWLTAGKTALASYMGELGLSDEAKAGTFESQFQKTPGYDFAVEEGEAGVMNNLAALGMKGSGAGMKALTRFRTGLADQTYQNYLTRIGNVATGGQQQVAANTAAGANYAINAGNTMEQAGAARASGYVGGANAWSNALSGLSNSISGGLGMLGNGAAYQNPNANGLAALRPGYQMGV